MRVLVDTLLELPSGGGRLLRFGHFVPLVRGIGPRPVSILSGAPPK